jgi:hypothetical protein
MDLHGGCGARMNCHGGFGARLDCYGWGGARMWRLNGFSWWLWS